LWLFFNIAHFSAGFFIMYKDLSGEWSKYKLIPEDKSEDKLKKYKL